MFWLDASSYILHCISNNYPVCTTQQRCQVHSIQEVHVTKLHPNYSFFFIVSTFDETSYVITLKHG